MDFTSPVIIATIIGLVFTQLIGRFVDHHYDKNYRVLERNLQIKKLLGDDSHNASLDELIRRQLNSYIVYEMGNVREERKHKVYLFGIGMIVALAIAITVATFQNGYILWGIAASVVTAALGIFYYERKSTWFVRVPAENTQYKAMFKNGKYADGFLMLDIIPSDGGGGTLDHPFLYVEDIDTEYIHEYKRVSSSGSISISSGSNTDLLSEYVFSRLYDGMAGRKVAGKNPIISSLVVTLENNEHFDVSDALIIAKPIKGAFSLVTKIPNLLKRKPVAVSSEIQGNATGPTLHTGKLPIL